MILIKAFEYFFFFAFANCFQMLVINACDIKTPSFCQNYIFLDFDISANINNIHLHNYTFTNFIFLVLLIKF